jgi:hypothetical protein
MQLGSHAVVAWRGHALPFKKHPDHSEHAYFLAVETAFKNWEAMQNVGH